MLPSGSSMKAWELTAYFQHSLLSTALLVTWDNDLTYAVTGNAVTHTAKCKADRESVAKIVPQGKALNFQHFVWQQPPFDVYVCEWKGEWEACEWEISVVHLPSIIHL